MTRTKAIEISHLSVVYRRRTSLFGSEEYTALKDISFNVYRGETLGIVGKNGAGKSTLLRVLAGIIKPDHGRITHYTKSVSLMALGAGFDSNLTGKENALISGMLLGNTKRVMLSKLPEIRMFSELSDFFDKPVRTYSSGMKARLAFSTALSISPDVLLMDEVLAVGDAGFKRKATLALEQKTKSNITVVIVSHSENQVSKLADRAIWIDGGTVRREGPPEEVFSEYNINATFSMFRLRVDRYVLNKRFFIQFEVRDFRDGALSFDCVIIDLEDRPIAHVAIENQGQESPMVGPTVTPGFSARHRNLKNARRCRFHDGRIIVGEPNAIEAFFDDDSKEVILSIQLSPS